MQDNRERKSRNAAKSVSARVLREQAAKEKDACKQATNEQPLNEQSLNEQPLNEEPVGKRTSRQYSSESEFEYKALAVLEAVVNELGGQRRSGQEEMVRGIAHMLEKTGHLIVQAGTGTGKSFAYLVPALLWCVERDRKIIVSTATLALQRQIMLHDAPLVTRAVGSVAARMPKVALLKGWNNYACLRKAAGGYPEDGALLSRMEAEYGSLSSTAAGEEVMRVRDWAMASATGDRDDLMPGVSDRIWAQVSVPKQECIGESCPLRDSCFPHLARLEADEADLVVTNHSMLGVAAAGTPILPNTDAYIIDEAHVLVERVTSQLTQTLSKYDVTGVARLMRRSALDDCMLDSAAEELDEVLHSLPEARIEELPSELVDAIARVLGRVQEAYAELESMKPNGDEQAILRQILRSRLGDIESMCSELLTGAVANGSLVVWNAVVGDDTYRLYAAPLDVSAALATRLFSEQAVALTSATLKIGGTFNPVAHRIGFDILKDRPWEGLDVGTPFDYAKQGILYVAQHLPEPGKQGYGEEYFEEILALMRASGGGALGLFTSRAAADRAADYVRKHSSFSVLCQGEDQLSTLIERFKDDDTSSLFGTMALWQGVDVPGRTLRLVIIDRIPFPRPNEPLTQARTEAAQAAKRNAFMEVSATQAALLLAQGAGRLLRRTDDRGVVAVLDSRLCTKRYASFLLASMPPMWRTTSLETVCGALQRLISSY